MKLGQNLKVDLKVGDRVSATVAGSKYPSYPSQGKLADLRNPCLLDSAEGRGAFAEYAKVPSDLVWKIPQGTYSFEQAAATGSPYVTRSLPM